MSLQVWLPLNGDFHNQGLSGDFNFTTTGTISDQYGKIGMSKGFNASNVIAPYNFTLGTQASFCCWVYYNALPASGSNDWIFDLASASGYAKAVLGLSTGNSTLAIMVGGKYDSSYTHGFETKHWYHMAFTWNNSEGKLYIDGKLKHTYTNLNNGTLKTSSKISLGSNVANSATKLNGRINDVRIYDHCLSAKEVEEIAKGLILHYKLDSISNPNLFTSIKSHNPTQYLGYQLYISEKLTTDTYTVQLWNVNVSHTGKAENEIGIGLYWGGGTLNLTNKIGTKYFKDGHADYLCFQIKPTSAQVSHSNASNLWLNIYNSPGDKSGTRNMSIGAWKLEKGAVATPPPLSNDIIYDSSGYNNNGTIVGDLTAATDTPRYNTSTSFVKTSYIKNDNFIYGSVRWSVSLWYFKPTAPSGYESLFSLSKNDGSDNNKKIAIIPNSSYIWFKCESGSGTLNSLQLNKWTHLVLTSEGKVYENGVEKLSITPGTGLTDCTDLVIGARSSADNVASVSVPYEGKISDVRMYAIALTPDQILELYNTSATIDKSGNVYAREFKEQ